MGGIFSSSFSANTFKSNYLILNYHEMKKSIISLSFMMLFCSLNTFASGGCSVSSCPGGNSLCCSEKKSILWGAY